MSKDYATSYNQFSTFREESSHGVGDPYIDGAKHRAHLHERFVPLASYA